MAYRRTSRSSARRSSTRSRRAAPRRSGSYARKTTRRTSRRTASLGRTLRIEIVQPGANPLARPDLIGLKPDLVRPSNRSKY